MGENIKINNLLVNNNNSNSSTLFLFHLVEVCFVCPPPHASLDPSVPSLSLIQSFPYERVREDVLAYLTHALGDCLTAEYVLLALLSRVIARSSTPPSTSSSSLSLPSGRKASSSSGGSGSGSDDGFLGDVVGPITLCICGLVDEDDARIQALLSCVKEIVPRCRHLR